MGPEGVGTVGFGHAEGIPPDRADGSARTHIRYRSPMVDLADIQEARQRIAGSVRVTPCLDSAPLSEELGLDIHLKLECHQITGSFKPRGACNRILTLTDKEAARGVVAASAGNHAQGLAYAAAQAGVTARIVMPETTPQIKIKRTRALGAEVELTGTSFNDASERAREIERVSGAIFVSAFDDPAVIAGQGSVGLELLEQIPDLEAVVTPVGGGGLASGIATALKETNPTIEIYGVQTEAAPAMHDSFRAGELVPVESKPSIADGIAIKHPGELTLAALQRYLDGMVLVSEAEIEHAIFDLLESGKVVAEGAGAAAFAAVRAERLPQLAGKRVAVVISGGNIDLNLLTRIIDRSSVYLGRMVRIDVPISDRPGSLARLLATVGEAQASVLKIRHRRAFAETATWGTEVELTLEMRGPEHVEALLDALAQAGFEGVQRSGMTLSSGAEAPD